VVGSDITQGADFPGRAPETGVSAIITNPPYTLAQKFIERALHFDDIRVVAMLLRTDFDHAASRAHLQYSGLLGPGTALIAFGFKTVTNTTKHNAPMQT
jgi:hypothetical protein